MALNIQHGFHAEERGEVARLFWQAFRGKLYRILGKEEQALAFLREVLNPDYAIVARNGQGQVMGLSGFKTDKGGLVGGGFRDLAAIYGRFGALWRGWLLSLLERDLAPGVLLMDGIFVAEAARGQGVGTALLEAVKTHAVFLGQGSVRLDVIDSNPRAKALYLREGFRPIGQQHLGPLRHVFGFRSVTQMVWTPDGEE